MGLLEEEDRRWFKDVHEAIELADRWAMEKAMSEEQTKPMTVLPGKVEDLKGGDIKPAGGFRGHCPAPQRTPRSNTSLLGLLREHSYKSGTFTLASGKQSDFYIDCKQTFLRREGLWAAAGKLYSLTDRFDAVAVAGEGAGGVPLAAAVSMYSGVFGPDNMLDCIIVRKGTKDHGTTQRVERSKSVPDGSRVVLVEDVLTSGGSALRAVKALQADGLKVVAVIALVSRREGAEELFFHEAPELISLYKREDFVAGE